MYTFSQVGVWLPFYAVLLGCVVRLWRKEAVWVVLTLVLCVVLADQISSGIIKPLVQRPRPTHAEGLRELVHTVHGYRGGYYGFVSSHAANTFGLALLCTLLFRRRAYAWTLFGWAALTAYSRVYLGVHYPSDLLGGALVGLAVAWGCYAVLRRCRPSAVSFISPPASRVWVCAPLAALGLTALAIAIASTVS